MKFKLLIVSLFISLVGFSQKAYLDSLWKVWSDVSQSDTNRLKAMYDFAWDGYLYTNPDSSYYFSEQMYAFAKEKGQDLFQAKALNLQFSYFFGKGDLKMAMEKNSEALKLREKNGDKLGMAVCAVNSGILSQVQGDFSNAIDYYTLSLKYNEEVNNKMGVATSLHNIGHLYQEQFNFDKAIQYYTKSLKIREMLNDQVGISSVLINLGSVYFDKKNYVKSLEYNNRSLLISKAIDNKQAIAAAMGNIGMIYQNLNDLDKGLDYFKQSLAIQEELGQKQTMAISILNIGSIYFAKMDIPNALLYSNKSFEIAKEIGDVSGIKSASKSLYMIYKSAGRYTEALNMHELYIQMTDSINSESSKKELVRQEFKYEYEKKVIADSVRTSEQKKIVAVQFKQEQTQRYALYVGLSLLLVFGGFMFNRFKVTQKQKNIIEEQKLFVENKQREIMDSIYYARRIQQSLLPSENYISKNMKRLLKNS